MIKKSKRTIALLASVSMLFGTTTNVKAFEKTYNDPYSYAQEYLRFTGVSTVCGEKYTKGTTVKVALFDADYDAQQEDLKDMWAKDTTLINEILGNDTTSGHGCVCAAMISTTSDNGKGTAGISNNIEIYPLPAYKKTTNYDFSDLEKAIRFCMSQNIQILSYSRTCYANSDSLLKAIKDYENWGGIIVGAAGNEAVDNERTDNSGKNNYGNAINSELGTQMYIGKFALKNGVNNIIEVTSTRDKEYSLFANYGKNETNIGAPGEFVLVPNNMYWPNGARKTEELPYSQNGGTSLATPYVAGVCALLKSHYPEATMLQIKQAILDGAEKRASLQERCSSGGMINAVGAMKALQKILNVPTEDGIYYIKNKNGNYLTTSSTANGANVSTSSFEGSNKQKWIVNRTSDGKYVLISGANYSMALTAYNGWYSKLGNNVAQNNFTESTSQKWRLDKTSTNTFKIIAGSNGGYCVNAANSATRGDGNKVNQATLQIAPSDHADTWTFEKVEDTYSDTYYLNIGAKYIQSASTSAAAALTGADFSENAYQTWRFIYRGNNTYTVHPASKTSVCLALKTGNSSDETIPVLANYSSGDSKQKWKVQENSDGTKYLINPNISSTKCITLDSNSNIVNALKSSSSTKQKIKFEAADSILSGTYYMKNSEKNLYVSSKSTSGGQYIGMNSTTETNNQKWNFKYYGNGDYAIIPYVNTNLRLDAFNGTPYDNWAAWQYTDNGSNAQRWNISKNEDETYCITTKLNSNYALNYNSAGDTSTYNNAMLSVKTRNSKSLSQKWVLEQLGKDVLDGKTVKYSYGSSILDYAKLVYVGNDQYVIQKDGKNIQLQRWVTREYYDESTKKVAYGRKYGDINCTYSYQTPSYGDDNQRFVIRYINANYYICPCEVRTSAITADGSNTWINKDLSTQRFSLN